MGPSQYNSARTTAKNEEQSTRLLPEQKNYLPSPKELLLVDNLVSLEIGEEEQEQSILPEIQTTNKWQRINKSREICNSTMQRDAKQIEKYI